MRCSVPSALQDLADELHRTPARDHVVTIVDDGDEASFDIHVRRSFAEYLWLWLADAGLEYGVGVDR